MQTWSEEEEGKEPKKKESRTALQLGNVLFLFYICLCCYNHLRENGSYVVCSGRDSEHVLVLGYSVERAGGSLNTHTHTHTHTFKSFMESVTLCVIEMHSWILRALQLLHVDFIALRTCVFYRLMGLEKQGERHFMEKEHEIAGERGR